MAVVELTATSPVPTELPFTVDLGVKVDLVLESKDFIETTITISGPHDLSSIEFTMYVIDNNTYRNNTYRIAPWKIVEIRFMAGERYICRVNETSIDQRFEGTTTISVKALILQAYKDCSGEEEDKKGGYPLLGRKLRFGNNV